MNIVKKNTKFLAYITGATLLLVAASTSASAILMTFIDKVDPNPDKLISFGTNQSYSFTHSIIADQDGAGMVHSGTYGYNSLTDRIVSASIVLAFRDESSDAASELVQLTFDAQPFGTPQTITSGGLPYTTTISNLSTLLNDGILNVTLQNAGTMSGPMNNRSDFLFINSTLTVQIPEPAPLVLICLGVAGLVFSYRKQVVALK